MGLTVHDLFDDVAGLTPEQRRQAAQAKVIRNADLNRQRVLDRKQRNRIFQLEKLVNALGAKLALNAHDEEVGRLFRLACERLHEEGCALPWKEDGPLRSEAPRGIPKWVADALVEIERTFNGKGMARSEQLSGDC
jgi:hypothetical protein